MCGIAGIIDLNRENVSGKRLKQMTDIIAHRGPDGEGHWISSNGNVGLGHRRLSVIDLSHEAAQPMHYLDRYTLVFNGEIYNYPELKEILLKEGYLFKTSGDTEVLLALYDRDQEKCLHLLDGMFSFVIYDKQKNEIFAARDRFGEKPFYYSYKAGSHFIFGSEMKCLWESGIRKSVRKEMLFNYLERGFIHNPEQSSETFYDDCTLLPHAHYIKLTVSDIRLDIKKYYELAYDVKGMEISREDAAERFKELFYRSVKRRLRSDVTVGSSLSGGPDSSLVVCVIDDLKKGSGQKQDTFSAVFPGFERDERKYMDAVIGRTNVSPHFVTPTVEDMIKDMDDLFFHQEEPFGSASIYIQYCVMKKAREQGVTVLLDGQGADEILAGYHHYYRAFFRELKRSDKGAYLLQKKAYHELQSGNLINYREVNNTKNRISSLAGAFAPALKKFYHRYQYLKNPFFHADFYQAYKDTRYAEKAAAGSLNAVLYQDTFVAGLQDLLRYADRNSMAHGREVRLPFLFYELVEFIMMLPPEFKINQGWTKWIMRETFKNILPPEIAWRRDKIGYEPPQRSWMENPAVCKKISGAKEILADHKIITRATLDKKIIPGPAPENSGKNWSFLMAGEMLKK